MKPRISLATGALLLCTIGLIAADQPQKKPAMPPDQKAAMEAMARAATPGEPHKALASFVGKWDASIKTWMQPGAPPTESKGTATNTAILGGRFIQQSYDGQFMGQPFSGLGFWGYDNVKKQYVSSWMDTMTTGVMTMVGTHEGNAYAFKGSVADPATGKDTPMEEKWTVKDKDHHTFEMWGPGPDGKMVKMMEIAYTRKK